MRHLKENRNWRRPGNALVLLATALVVCACTPREPAVPHQQTPPDGPANSDPSAVMPAAAGPEALAATVAEAARARDYATLAAHMADAFSYSFGQEPSREGGLAVFRAEPERLDLLADILARDCVRDTLAGLHWYICPAAAADEQQDYYGWRAGFRQRDDGDWEFVWFIAGD
ncbi:MAG TPA: hypothetical protein VF200_15175 [Woeseiaceae bacterium]